MNDMAADYKIRPITVYEYLRMGELGVIGPEERVELLDGELIAMPPSGEDHSFGVNEIVRVFYRHFADRTYIQSQSPIRLNELSEPEPDVVLLAPREDRYRKHRPLAGDVLLVVEVSDTSLRYDRGRKLEAYARAGIPEVWIVNVPDRCVERYAGLVGGRYAPPEIARAGGMIAPEAFPNEPLAVDEFLP